MTEPKNSDWISPVVRLLSANVGRTIPFERIAVVAGIGPDSDRENGVKVRVCHARKRLPDLIIKSDRGVGYSVELRG